MGLKESLTEGWRSARHIAIALATSEGAIAGLLTAVAGLGHVISRAFNNTGAAQAGSLRSWNVTRRGRQTAAKAARRVARFLFLAGGLSAPRQARQARASARQ